jgi:hypothetical protein
VAFFIFAYVIKEAQNHGKRTRKKHQKQGFTYQIAQSEKDETSGGKESTGLTLESFSYKNESEKE